MAHDDEEANAPHQEPPNEEPPPRARPVAPGERIVTLDVLRGLALFGILIVNVAAFSEPADWFHVDWDSPRPARPRHRSRPGRS